MENDKLSEEDVEKAIGYIRDFVILVSGTPVDVDRVRQDLLDGSLFLTHHTKGTKKLSDEEMRQVLRNVIASSILLYARKVRDIEKATTEKPPGG